MKKALLTSVLLFGVLSSYANEDRPKSEMASAEPKKVEQKAEQKVELLKPAGRMPECYVLTCGTKCFAGPVEYPNCDIQCVFDKLEAKYCSNESVAEP
ncbi:MAG: hypothetical protein QM669_04815 [Siphonobacter sp.]